MKKIISLFAFAALVTVSCNDMKELNERVDNLENRVETLETLTTTMNGQVEALQTFVSNNKSISKVEKATDGTYTLTLSDGSTIVLKQGSEGDPVMPEIAINNDGNWTVNGTVLTVGGNPVPATGANGATPIFGVDAEGYWTVKYAADGTPERVLDVNGQPVKATPSGVTPGESNDSFFSSVVADTDKVTITLKADGKSYSLPVIPDFMCAITGAEAQPVIFTAGETKAFNVTQKNVAAATIFRPDGWNASLSENLLTVTAPAATKSGATADTRQDVGILAISNTGFAAISKIMVQLDDTPIVVTPTVALAAGEATQNSLTFTVTLSNASKWYYMLQKSDVEAPAAEALKAAAEGSETTLTLDKDASGADLVHSTSYTLYVLPVNDTAEGSVASVTKSTAEKVYASLYEKYNDGGDIVIDGIAYNNTSFEGLTATLITAESDVKSITGDGIYFIDPGVNVTYDGTGGVARMIIIGNNPNQRSNFASNQFFKLNQSTHAGTFVCKNMICDFSGTKNVTNVAGYVMAMYKDGYYNTITFVNCQIKPISGKPLISTTTTGRNISNIVIKDCEYVTDASQHRIIVTKNNAEHSYEFTNVKILNSIFYNTTSSLPSDFKIAFCQNDGSFGKITLENNTFVNCPPAATVARYIYAKGITSAYVKNNIFYNEISYTNNIALMQGVTTAPTSGEIANNIGYLNADGKQWQSYFGGLSGLTGDWTKTEITKLTESPFSECSVENCRFIPVADYAAYGAQR